MRAFISAFLSALGGVFADKGARSTMVAAILIYSVLYPQPYTGEVIRDVPLVAVDQDQSVASRDLLRRIGNTDGARIAAVVSDLPAARDLFFARKAHGILLIPPRFEEDLLSGRPSPIAAYGDASYPLIYSALMSAIASAAGDLGAGVQYARLTATGTDPATAAAMVAPVTVTNVAVYNPQGGYASYVVPAAFVLILQQTLLMGIGILHAGRNWRSGVVRLATPLAYIALYLAWVALTQLMLPLIYGIPRLGNVGTLFAVALPFLCAVTAMGFALARAIPWREGVIFFLVVLGIPLFFLSGISWPAESIPEPLRWLGLLIPSSSAIPAFVMVNQMGADLADVADAVRLQIGLTIGYTVLAAVFAMSRRKNTAQDTAVDAMR